MRGDRSKSKSGSISFVCACLMLCAAFVRPSDAAARLLSIDDVLGLSRVDRAVISPDGEFIAIVVHRPARAGEVFGRTYYDLDPSRGDIWLVSRRTGERRNLTQGAGLAAGFWCPAWSPDGRRLAMLSTKPEGSEPRGGDNVRLYTWNRDTGTLERVSQAPMMSQSMGGSPMYRVDLRGGADRSRTAHRCSQEENAPFAWLDNRRLLAVTLRPDAVSGLIDPHLRPFRHGIETARALRGGSAPTVTAVASGSARQDSKLTSEAAVLRKVDVASGASDAVAALPIYPFRSELSLAIAPDGKRIAVLAPIGGIPPATGVRSPHFDDAWSVVKRLGFVDLAPGSTLRWAPVSVAARYPLELYDWSPNSRQVAFRARADSTMTSAGLFVTSLPDLSTLGLGGSMSIGGAFAGSAYSPDEPVLWVDDRRLLARLRWAQAAGAANAGPQRSDWWLLSAGSEPENITSALAKPPGQFRRRSNGSLFAMVGERLMEFDLNQRRLKPIAGSQLPAQSGVVWPRDPALETSHLVAAGQGPGGSQEMRLLAVGGATSRAIDLPQGAQLLDVDFREQVATWRHSDSTGSFVRETSFADGARRDLLSLNHHLASIDWGRTMLVEYRGKGGAELKGAVILPPGYREGQRYPTITWVYPGYRVEDLNDYWLDAHLAGIYNLQLYAARGYVVLIPSIPIDRAPSADIMADIEKGVLPAVDRLVKLGIADPQRLAVMGQSFGGYGVYALVTRTNRFRAAVAMAGITDFAAFYTQFDSTARGYPAIEHEKSLNWSLLEAGHLGLGVPPFEDRALYRRNSPLGFAERVQTPLLLIHGEHDVRAPMSQAESFFYSLYRQGKTARLLRYWGENHGLTQSPANVRDILHETLSWLDRYLTTPGPAAPPQRGPSAAPFGE